MLAVQMTHQVRRAQPYFIIELLHRVVLSSANTEVSMYGLRSCVGENLRSAARSLQMLYICSAGLQLVAIIPNDGPVGFA